jgi:uncharacterized protein DUF6529
VEDLIDSLTRGNVTEVKVLLASVALGLGVYQLVLAAVGYGRLRMPVLGSKAAFFSHRALGDVILVLVVLTAIACIAYFGAEDDYLLHVVAGSALLGVLALKVIVVRWIPRLGGLLPVLGVSVFLLLALTWATSAGDLLADR